MKPEDGVMPKKIFLVHGDEDAKVEFAEHLRKELKTEVLIPKEGMTVDLS
jgi:predicted metal-dependent RNase